jgi:hypothetical protein
MRLAAIATGAGVPDSAFAGTVAHVCPRVCLLAVADGTLLTLATADVGHLPRGITLAFTPAFLLPHHVTAAAEFAVRGGILRFSTCTFCVDLRGAVQWRSGLARLQLEINNPAILRAWRTVRTLLVRDGRSKGLQLAAGAAIDKLTTATQRLDTAAAREAVAALVGLGEGTTPAGDDFLVGYIAGLLSSADLIAARTTFVLTLCKQIKAAASRTHRVSRMYLEAAAMGEISQRLYALAVCMADGADDAAVIAAARGALEVGHSSGACGILGLLVSCVAWSCKTMVNESAETFAPCERVV